MVQTSKAIIEQTQKYGANNYLPLPIVIHKAEGIWVEDPEGNRYMDLLSAYSAVNKGHCHPKIIAARKEQADKVTLTSRAFHNDQLGACYEKRCKLTNKEMALNMNTGTDNVETAIKTARRCAYDAKGLENNKRGFGPMLTGIKLIPFGDVKALKEAINENTAGFLIEPVQGEAGVNMPEEGFLKQAYDVCKENNVLFMADEIQAGLGRSGKMFACDWENIEPDVLILGKALGGGVMPISCVVANEDILGVFEPGSHGSTFGGNSLACAVSIAALDVIIDDKLPERSQELGEYFKKELQSIDNPIIKEVRGKGLFIGMELTEKARPYCEKLMEKGL